MEPAPQDGSPWMKVEFCWLPLFNRIKAKWFVRMISSQCTIFAGQSVFNARNSQIKSYSDNQNEDPKGMFSQRMLLRGNQDIRISVRLFGIILLIAVVQEDGCRGEIFESMGNIRTNGKPCKSLVIGT